MTRLIVHVEGQTEEAFVNEVLRPHLVSAGYFTVSAKIFGNARLRSNRGGVRPWPSVRRDILNHLKQDPECLSTTMADFYGMPTSGEKAWPGRAEANHVGSSIKASTVEQAMLADVAAGMGQNFRVGRFVPFVLMHEFEALLFSDCKAFGDAIGQPSVAHRFQSIRNGFASPEDINDSPLTAPSKRVEAILPGYEKPLMGVIGILGIGLDRILAECAHFRDWISRLEALAP